MFEFLGFEFKFTDLNAHGGVFHVPQKAVEPVKCASSDSILTSDVHLRVDAALRGNNAAQRHQSFSEQSVLRQRHVLQFVQTQALTHAQVRIKRTRSRLHQVGACAAMRTFRARNEPVHIEVRVELQKGWLHSYFHNFRI